VCQQYNSKCQSGYSCTGFLDPQTLAVKVMCCPRKVRPDDMIIGPCIAGTCPTDSECIEGNVCVLGFGNK